jgi:putative membrane protein
VRFLSAGMLGPASGLADAHHDGALDVALGIEPWVLVLVIVAAITYAIGFRRRWRSAGARRRVGMQGAAFATGLGSIVFALGGPIERWSDSSFAAHMLQHEILMLVTALLLVLGRPLATWAWSLPASCRRRLHPLRGRALLRAAWKSLTSHWGAALLQVAALWIWHAPPLFDAAVRDPWIHALQHTTFLMSACCFWWSITRTRGLAPMGPAMLGLFLTMIATGALGALLTFAPAPWYAVYARAGSPFGLSPLEEQQLGGLIMWVPGGTVYLAAALWLFHDVLRARAARRAPHGIRAIARVVAAR